MSDESVQFLGKWNFSATKRMAHARLREILHEDAESFSVVFRWPVKAAIVA